MPRNASEDAVTRVAQADPGVQKFTAGKEIRKVIYVPNRLINIVVAG